jgi:hypothetical protein
MNIDLKKISESKNVRILIYTLAIFFVAVSIFQAGMFVGFHKASFSYKFGENYYNEAFGGRRDGFGMGMQRDMFMGGHGATGKIVKISLPTIVVAGKDNTEKVIRIDDDTVIREFRDEVTAQNLKLDDVIVVIGSPNDNAEIQAKLIRILPPPPQANTVQATSTTKTTSIKPE